MARCTYYREEIETTHGSPLEAQQRQAPGSECGPWCEHPKHSPRPSPRKYLSEPLTCEGRLYRCPLSKLQFEDIH
jgi:hypothetical protein